MNSTRYLMRCMKLLHSRCCLNRISHCLPYSVLPRGYPCIKQVSNTLNDVTVYITVTCSTKSLISFEYVTYLLFDEIRKIFNIGLPATKYSQYSKDVQSFWKVIIDCLWKHEGLWDNVTILSWDFVSSLRNCLMSILLNRGKENFSSSIPLIYFVLTSSQQILIVSLVLFFTFCTTIQER